MSRKQDEVFTCSNLHSKKTKMDYQLLFPMVEEGYSCPPNKTHLQLHKKHTLKMKGTKQSHGHKGTKQSHGHLRPTCSSLHMFIPHIHITNACLSPDPLQPNSEITQLYNHWTETSTRLPRHPHKTHTLATTREIMLFIGKPMGRSIMISNAIYISETLTVRLELHLKNTSSQILHMPPQARMGDLRPDRQSQDHTPSSQAHTTNPEARGWLPLNFPSIYTPLSLAMAASKLPTPSHPHLWERIRPVSYRSIFMLRTKVRTYLATKP